MTNNQIEKVGIVILAAGLGTRMKSDKAKVLHRVCGRPMISYVLEAACQIADRNVVVVVGHQAERVKAVCRASGPVSFALQREQRGTGHAVLCAMPALADDVAHVIILCGDVPLLTAGTIRALLADHIEKDRELSLLAVELDNPTGYGRVVMTADRVLTRIVEEADASADEKDIKLINSGIYCVSRSFLDGALQEIRPDNAQGEFYLTDIIAIGYAAGRRIGVLVGSNPDEVSGVNTVADLTAVEKLLTSK